MANLCNKKTFTKEFTKSDVTKKIVERGEMAFFIVYHQWKEKSLASNDSKSCKKMTNLWN